MSRVSMFSAPFLLGFDAFEERVDRLAKAEFPVKQLSIVGSGLKTVERVTGKLSNAKAAGAGARGAPYERRSPRRSPPPRRSPSPAASEKRGSPGGSADN